MNLSHLVPSIRTAVLGLVAGGVMVAGMPVAEAASHAVCMRYANLAVRQQNLNRTYRCGFRGPRWHRVWSVHYTWCRGVPYRVQLRERQARRRMLMACGAIRPPVRRRVFHNPKIGGLRLDWCRFWARQCGAPAANTFCRMRGYRRAIAWQKATDIGRWVPTRVIATGQVCRGNFCDGFRFITCER